MEGKYRSTKQKSDLVIKVTQGHSKVLEGYLFFILIVCEVGA